jgi:arylsulfatase A-like enzyme
MAEKYMDREVPLPDVTEDELADLPPPWVEKRVHDVEVDHDSVSWKLSPTRDELHRMRAYYYANVEMIDAQVGRIIDALEARGNLDNTIIIFTSDHGDNLGDHGLVQKWAPYEQVTRVPLIVSSPGRFDGGRSVDAMVQLFDIGPTILEWAGLSAPEHFEAQSLNPVLLGEPFAGRDHVFCEQAGDGNMTGATYLTMIRSRTHKLVHFQGQPLGQLFDLQSDPMERRNLWDEPTMRDTRDELLRRMLEFHIDSTVQTQNGRKAVVAPLDAEHY